MTAAPAARRGLDAYVADAAGQYDLLGLGARDTVLRAAGYQLHYAADSNVLDLYLAPRKGAASGEHRRLGFGEVFHSDSIERKTVLAAALGRFLWYDLQPAKPLLFIPPVDQEVHALIEQVEALTRPSAEDWTALNALVARIRAAGHEPNADDVATLRDMVLLRGGRPQMVARLHALLESRRFLGVDAVPWAEPGEVDDAFASVLRPWTALADMLEFADARERWLGRLRTVGRPPGRRMERDAEALARLEVWNLRLEASGAWRRLLYITGDNSILMAGAAFSVGAGETFRDRFLRHPRSYLDDQRVLHRSQAPQNPSGPPDPADSLGRWIELLIGRFKDEGSLGAWAGGRFVLKPSIIDQVREVEWKDPGASDRIRAEWDEFMRGVADTIVAERDRESEVEAVLREGVQALRDALREMRPKIESEIREAWKDCVAVFTTTRFLIEMFSSTRPRARGAPYLCLDGHEAAAVFLKRAREWYDDPSAFNPGEFALLRSSIEDHEPTGYNFALAIAYLLTGGQQWSSAAFLCAHANRLSVRPETGPLPVDGPNGREAHFLEAFCRRHAARSAMDLDSLDALLDRAEAISRQEREGEPGHDCVPERFQAERLALRLSHLLFSWSETPEQGRPGLAAAFLGVADAVRRLGASVVSRHSDLGEQGVGSPAPSDRTRVPVADRQDMLADLHRRGLINLVGIGLLFRDDPRLQRIAIEAFKTLKADAALTGPATHSNYFRRVVFSCGEVLFGDESERRRAIRCARELLSDDAVRRNRVFPYDTERFRAFKRVVPQT